jgi:hypothetical protein
MSPRVPEAQDAEDAMWRKQERLWAELRSSTDTSTDDAGDRLYRQVFAAIDQESLPALPDDFAVRVAADAQRLAEARTQVSRFKAMLVSLLSVLYLPAMFVAALMYWPRWSLSVAGAPFDAHALPVWLVAVVVLGLSVVVVEGISRRVFAEMAD